MHATAYDERIANKTKYLYVALFRFVIVHVQGMPTFVILRKSIFICSATFINPYEYSTELSVSRSLIWLFYSLRLSHT